MNKRALKKHIFWFKTAGAIEELTLRLELSEKEKTSAVA